MILYDIEGNVISSTKITNFADVKEYGAIGNGVTDDASVIQSALDDLKTTGGIIYFPYGTYLVKTALLFYSNQTLMFADGATILRGLSTMNNVMRNYNTSDITGYNGTHNVKIIGATFDGDSSFSSGTSVTLLGFCHSKNIEIKDCKFKNGNGVWHDLEINSSQYVLVENCEFDGSLKSGDGGEDIQLDYAGSSQYYPWTCNMDNTISTRIEIKGCKFYGNTISPAIGNHSGSGSGSYVRVHDCFFDTNTAVDTNVRNRATVSFNAGTANADVYNNTFYNCTNCFYAGGGGNNTFHDNRVVGATSIYRGSTTTAYNNLINGTFIEPT